jgi:hypothetical protein
MLKPDRCLLLACIRPETAATTRALRAESGVAVLSKVQIEAMHRAAGLASLAIETYDEMSHYPYGTAFPPPVPPSGGAAQLGC